MEPREANPRFRLRFVTSVVFASYPAVCIAPEASTVTQTALAPLADGNAAPSLPLAYAQPPFQRCPQPGYCRHVNNNTPGVTAASTMPASLARLPRAHHRRPRGLSRRSSGGRSFGRRQRCAARLASFCRGWRKRGYTTARSRETRGAATTSR